ncbi:MAG: 6-phosphogluconolactonase [Fimbriimonadaceae bacterium]|nr:6-phosphogluconolactonase [Fimbriimonadaceae bacterium]
MTYRHFSHAVGLAEAGADLVDETLATNPEAHLVLATGSSPLGLYRELVRRGRRWDRAWVTKLDEWLGLPPNDPATCEAYLRREAIGPLAAPEERYLAFDGLATDSIAECARVQRALCERPSVDLAILGIGRNGHLGLNEPGSSLHPGCHVAALAPTTRSHPMLDRAGSPPTHGLTLGIGDLLSARRILLIVSGDGKEEAFRSLNEGLVTTSLPASFLHLHRDVVCLSQAS